MIFESLSFFNGRLCTLKDLKAFKAVKIFLILTWSFYTLPNQMLFDFVLFCFF